MAQELLARILHSLRPHNAGIYEKLAAQTAKRVRELALEVLNTFVTFGVAEDDFSDLDCFRQELDATLHNLVQKAITVAWIAHEASYSESARESVRSEALPGPTRAFGTSDGDPGTGARTLPRVFQTSADCCRDRDEREETSPAPAVSQPPVVPREPTFSADGAGAETVESVAQGVEGKDTDDVQQSDSKQKREGELALLEGKSDPPRQGKIKDQRPKSREGDPTLLGDKRLVSFKTAEEYLGISDRQRLNLTKSRELKIEGKGQYKQITTDSLRAYRPPENPK